MRRAVLVAGFLAAVLAAAAGPVQAADSTCRVLNRYCWTHIPRLFYAGEADSLFQLIGDWSYACGETEAIQRTRILAAVWDGAFSEEVYGEDILDALVEFREVLARRPTADAEDPRDRFDAFTIDLADQLLPHAGRAELETFFCLYYSGRVAEAWALLGSDDLAGSELGRWYANELEILAAPRKVVTLDVVGGVWEPDGTLGFVGTKPVVGVSVGVRGRGWLLRMPLELRVGRTGRPYYVPFADGVGYSDRFDAFLVGLEAGRSVPLRRRLDLDLFVGLGVDGVAPFSGEDLVLDGANICVGAGLRQFVGTGRTWSIGLDVRREWITERNPGGTVLDGSAWSLRMSLGWVHDQGRGARRRALTP